LLFGVTRRLIQEEYGMTEEIVVRAFEPHDASAVIELWDTVFPNDPPWNKPRDVIERKLSVQRDL
jgi:hypothetical protein